MPESTNPGLPTLSVQKGHGRSPILSAAIHPESNSLYTLDRFGRIVQWDIPTGKQAREIYTGTWRKGPKTIQTRKLRSLFKPTRLLIRGNQLYGYGANALYAMNINEPAGEILYSGETLSRFSLGGNFLVAASSSFTERLFLFDIGNKTIQDFNVSKLLRFKTLRGLAYNEENRHFAFACTSAITDTYQAQIYLLKVSAGNIARIAKRLAPRQCEMWELSPAADFIVYLHKGKLSKKELESGKLAVIAQDKQANYFRLSEDGRYCVLAANRYLKVYDLRNGEEFFTTELNEPHFPLAVSPPVQLGSGSEPAPYLVARNMDGAISLWNLRRKALARTFITAMPVVHHIELQDDDSLNVFFTDSRIYSLRLKDEIRFSPRFLSEKPFKMATISRDGRTAAIFYQTRKSDQFFTALQNGRSSEVNTGIRSSLRHLIFSPDGKYLAVSSGNTGRILIYETENFGKEADWTQGSEVGDIAFFPGKSLLAVAASSSSFRIFDWKADWKGKPKPPFVLEAKFKSIHGLKLHFSETGRYLILHGLGRSEIIEISDIDSGSYRQLFQPEEEGEQTILPVGLHNEHFTASPSFPSPVFTKDEQHILLQTKGRGSLQLWKPGILASALKAPAFGQGPFGPDFSIEGQSLAYFSFHLMRNSPCLIVYTVSEGLQLFDYAKREKEDQLLATIFPATEKRFIIVGARNFYYTTAEGYDLLAFKQNGRLFPLEQFDIWFNRPHEVLSRINLSADREKFERLVNTYRNAFLKRISRLIGEPSTRDWIRDARLEFIRDCHSPGVFIKDKDGRDASHIPLSTREPRLEIIIEGIDKNWELSELILLVNGVPLGGSRTEGVQNTHHFEKKAVIELSLGENIIQASVINQAGVESLKETARITFNGQIRPKSKALAEEPLQQASSLHLIGIGVGTHIVDEDKTLAYPKKNIENFFNALKAHDPRAVVDEAYLIFDQDAALAAVRERLKILKQKLAKTQVDDRILVFYSGHGILDDEENLFLSTTDAVFEVSANQPDKDKIIRGLPFNELESLLDGTGARNKLMFVDACNSGEIEKTEADSPGQFIAESNKINELFGRLKASFIDLRRGNGATILTSAQGWQKARQSDELENSYFAETLLNILGIEQGEQDSKPSKVIRRKTGTVMVSELVDLLINGVPRLSLAIILQKSFFDERQFDHFYQAVSAALLPGLSAGIPQDELEDQARNLLNSLVESWNEQQEDTEQKISMSPRSLSRLANKISLIQQPTLRAENVFNDWRIW